MSSRRGSVQYLGAIANRKSDRYNKLKGVMYELKERFSPDNDGINGCECNLDFVRS